MRHHHRRQDTGAHAQGEEQQSRAPVRNPPSSRPSTIDVEIDGDARFSRRPHPQSLYLNEMTGEFDWNVAPGTRIPGTSWALPVRSETRHPRTDGSCCLRMTGISCSRRTPTAGRLRSNSTASPQLTSAQGVRRKRCKNALAALATGGVVIRCEGGPLPDQNIRILLQNGVGAGPRLRAGDINATGGVTPRSLLSLATSGSAGQNHPRSVRVRQRQPLRLVGPRVAALGRDAGCVASRSVAALLRQPSLPGRGPTMSSTASAKYSLALDDYFEVRPCRECPTAS